MAIITEAQAILIILKGRKFTSPQIERLTGIHRVSLNHIRLGNYSGNNSLKYLEPLIKKILTNPTKQEMAILEAGIYHRDIDLQQLNHTDTKYLPSPTVYTQLPQNIYEQVKNFDLVPEQNSILWLQKHGTCTICKNRLGNSFTSGFILNKFVVTCTQCTTKYMEYIKPNPTT